VPVRYSPLFVKISRATPDEATVLTEIAFAAKRSWGYPESWIRSWENILTISPQFIAKNSAWRATEDKHTLGFYVLTVEGDSLHLDHLWIRPPQMRRGIGRALFEHAMAQARVLGFNRVEIEADPNAEAFYRHMGAERVGTNVGEVDGESRELPLLEYKVAESS
jgi:GNAT superfamily N-acetyltransferase